MRYERDGSWCGERGVAAREHVVRGRVMELRSPHVVQRRGLAAFDELVLLLREAQRVPYTAHRDAAHAHFLVALMPRVIALVSRSVTADTMTTGRLRELTQEVVARATLLSWSTPPERFASAMEVLVRNVVQREHIVANMARVG